MKAVSQQAIEDCLSFLPEYYGKDDAGIAAAAKANECSVEDVFEVMDSRFQNVMERHGINDSVALWEAATNFLFFGEKGV